MQRIIDTHIHLDQYEQPLRSMIINQADRAGIVGLISVSMNLASCRNNQSIAQQHPGLVYAAYGFHPEQPLPTDREASDLFAWIERSASSAAAIGEVGLPYYTAMEARRIGDPFDKTPYIELLKQFIQLAKSLDLPLILHAVYEDAPTVCNLLEEASYARAHFHWYKGDPKTTERMAENGYYISFTPDIVYESDIQTIAAQYPPQLTMAETDGPWPFEGPFAGKKTEPAMMHTSIAKYSDLSGRPLSDTYMLLLQNANFFYRLNKL